MERLICSLKKSKTVQAFICIISIVVAARLLLVSVFCETYSGSEYTKVYRSHENSSMKIALTFDDGPHPVLTPKILAVLEKYGINATFFTVGKNADCYPETLELIIKNGNEIGNHTHTHRVIKSASKHTVKREIEMCENAIYSHIDCRPKLFRPPEGSFGKNLIDASDELGYQIVLWNIDTRDWAHTPPEVISKNVVDNISSGSIILMHDYIGHNSPTVEALELFIPKLLQMGYKFVVVSELLGSS